MNRDPGKAVLMLDLVMEFFDEPDELDPPLKMSA